MTTVLACLLGLVLMAMVICVFDADHLVAWIQSRALSPATAPHVDTREVDAFLAPGYALKEWDATFFTETGIHARPQAEPVPCFPVGLHGLNEAMNVEHWYGASLASSQQLGYQRGDGRTRQALGAAALLASNRQAALQNVAAAHGILGLGEPWKI